MLIEKFEDMELDFNTYDPDCAIVLGSIQKAKERENLVWVDTKESQTVSVDILESIIEEVRSMYLTIWSLN